MALPLSSNVALPVTSMPVAFAVNIVFVSAPFCTANSNWPTELGYAPVVVAFAPIIPNEPFALVAKRNVAYS